MSKRTPDPVEYVHHEPGSKGGTCFYAWHFAGNSYFELATSVCSYDDDYDPVVGEELARDNAMEYRCIKLPLGPDSNRHTLTSQELGEVLEMVFTFKR